MAAVIGTILGVIPATLSMLTNPGAANDEATYPDCALIGSYDSSIVKPYWIIQSTSCMIYPIFVCAILVSHDMYTLLSVFLLHSVWGIPGQLLGLVISGFIFGAHQWLVGGWIMGISMVSIILVYIIRRFTLIISLTQTYHSLLLDS